MKQPINVCDYCSHCEMCAWRKEVEEQGCEFYDNGNKWIPCSERPPEPERRGQRRAWFLTTNEYGSVGECKYEFYDDTFGIGWDSDIRVVAWMPWPTPYKEGNTEGGDCE